MDRVELKQVVHVSVPEGIMDEIVVFVKERDPGFRLWNRTKTNFIHDQCYIYIYKMITGLGNTKLQEQLQLQPDLRFSHHTLHNNVTVLHCIIVEWAYTKINPGTAAEWNAAVAHREFQDPVAKVNLWADSSDFAMKVSPETAGWYSHKLRGRGMRVQFIVDGMERIRYVSGPLDPTQFDGNFLEREKRFFNETFKGGHIIADSHYSVGMKLFDDPAFYCNTIETAVDKEVAEKENLETHSRNRKRKIEIDLTKLSEEAKQLSMKKLKTNAVISHTRGLIEGVFGNMKRKFKVLSSRCISDKVYLFETVVIASAINNLIIERNNHF